jgi:hypothetical protein
MGGDWEPVPPHNQNGAGAPHTAYTLAAPDAVWGGTSGDALRKLIWY